jgi:hypothetical protein
MVAYIEPTRLNEVAVHEAIHRRRGPAAGTLLPECLDDYIGEDNPVRVVDVFVEELDGGSAFAATCMKCHGGPRHGRELVLRANDGHHCTGRPRGGGVVIYCGRQLSQRRSTE